jgi:hypothetical protein
MGQRLLFAIALSLGLSAFGNAEAATFVTYEQGDPATFKNDRLGSTTDMSIDRTSGNWKHYTNDRKEEQADRVVIDSSVIDVRNCLCFP